MCLANGDTSGNTTNVNAAVNAAVNDVNVNVYISGIEKNTINNYEPKNFATNNNLLRSTGEVENHYSNKIIIFGKVFSRNRKFVSDAKIFIWQLDDKGKYPYIPLRTKFRDTELIENNPSSFQGNGLTYSNNLGDFYFVTQMPASVKNVSYVNIRIELDQYRLQIKQILNQNLKKASSEFIETNIPQFILEYSKLNNMKIYYSDILLDLNL
ncbi:peptidase associated/transthyretin-like domain-containing protein [Rickettsia endosymbiont of Cardiosporidium cionae]|uniref:hypothetical protein n=1 Tax=Rickettsia endosymbiont of Cardiosporidium cionae TaxID=2777155 RepID=UPI001892EC56|nr:hypothetical protein [Rickettsia endosymbiont of Cardiosporidium cionae]